MCHGYAKIEGKPMAAMMHDTVGLQHGSMAIYNAYADRVPIFLITPTAPDLRTRKTMVHFVHSVQDGAAIVRDFVKWDDRPGSLQHWAESAARAWKYAMTPPYGPVLLVTSTDLQENPIDEEPRPVIPKPPKIAPPQAEDGALREAAQDAGRCRSAGAGLRPRGAHAGGHAVADRACRASAGAGGRCLGADEFSLAPSPQSDPAAAAPSVGQADVILGMEMTDFWATTHAFMPHTETSTQRIVKAGRQEHQPHRDRSQLPFQLSGFPALSRCRSVAGRRCRGEPAVADRGLPGADRQEQDVEFRAARQEAGRRASESAGRSARWPPPKAGIRSPSPPRGW